MITLTIHKPILRKLRATVKICAPIPGTASLTSNLFSLRLPRRIIPALAVLFLAACGSEHENHDGHDHDHSHNHEEHASSESTYVEGKGVQLSESGKDSLGVKIEEVRLETVQDELTLQAQIYREATESPRSNGTSRPGFAYASVFHNAGTAAGLEPGAAGVAQSGAESFSAQVIEVDRQLVETTGQVEYLIELPDPENQLELGEFIQVAFRVAGVENRSMVVVPDSAILRTARGDFAFAENQGYLFRAPVEVARVRDEQAVISEGLYEGDLVAANNVENLYLIELQVTNGGKGCAHGH